MSSLVCIPRQLTPLQEELALRRSLEINPANALRLRTIERTPAGRRGGVRRLALLVGNRWPEAGVDLTVQFLDSPSRELRSRILAHMNAWNRTANIQFRETDGQGQVRIARLDSPPDMAGYWSYVGTQILGIEEDQPTLNLEGFTMRTDEAEFRRVIRHEAGHTLGFEHEHMRRELVARIDPKKAFAHFDRLCGWTKEETLAQVLTPLDEASIYGTTESDPLSIMCYEIPGKITKDGLPIYGGTDINDKDYAFAAKVYPPRSAPSPERAEAIAARPPAGSTTAAPPPEEADTLHIVILDDFQPKAAGKKKVRTPAETERPKFARVFASYGGARVFSEMRLRADAGEAATSYGRIIRMHERIKNYTNLERGTLPSDEDLVAFGGELFDTIFQGDVRRLYDEARARQQNRKLDIVFTSMISWIAEKPWEFSYDAVRRSFLATEEVHWIRNVLTAVPAELPPPRSGPLRILVASAQPVGMGRLSIEGETEVIRRGFLPLIDAGLATIEVLPRATPRRMLEALSTGEFTVVHLCGHGAFDEASETGAIFLETDGGRPFPLNERNVREIFGKRGIALVFLNACQTGSGGRKEFNNGIAQSLVAHGLPAVVANQYSVLDTSATSFAQHLYWALANGMTIGQAACEARIAVNCSMQGELIDWAIPVVYARDPDLKLCAPPAKLRSLPAVLPSATLSKAARRQVQIAVWDIDNVFPALAQTLDKMNDAQECFGFELVSLSLPIDAWDLEQRAEDGTPYLWAEKLARRLQRLPAELKVDALCCITRHWMRDDDWLNLYGWWPAQKKPPITIFSCAGFDELPAQGAATDRAIVNVTVAMLAGMLADADSHDRPPYDCPLSFDEERDLARLTGPQQFDPTCRRKLQQKIPRELTALEALLAVNF